MSEARLCQPLFNRFTRDDKGVIGIIFALMIVPIVAIIGAGLDYRGAGQEQVKLRQAVEAVALAVAREQFKPLQDKVERQDLDQLMHSVFNANYTYNPDSVSGVAVNLDEVNVDSIKISATAAVATNFMKIVGFNTLSTSASAKAASRFSTSDVNIQMVVDFSTSMVVPDDGSPSPLSTTPYDPPGGGCFFMCHDDGSTLRNAGKTPKLDDIQEALGSPTGLIQRIQEAANSSSVNANFIGHAFDIGSLGPNEYASWKNARVAAVAPYNVGLRGAQGGTDLNQSFDDVVAYLSSRPAPSSGIQKDIIIIVSDGAHSRSHHPYDPARCNRLKAYGDVYTMHINTPISVYDNPNVTARIPRNGAPGPLYARDDPNAWDLNTWEHGGNNPDSGRGYYSGTANAGLLMRNCATKPDWAFEGETGLQIFDAMKAMTDAIIAPQISIVE